MGRIDDDEWTPSAEPITQAQIDEINRLLATPFRESDLQIFADDDEPVSPNPEESKP
jgi:hypothetical protein